MILSVTVVLVFGKRPAGHHSVAHARTSIPASTPLLHTCLPGEIVPQSVCSRYGLKVGYYSAWFVQALMFVCSPLAWPIGKLLDYVLGPEHSVGPSPQPPIHRHHHACTCQQVMCSFAAASVIVTSHSL